MKRERPAQMSDRPYLPRAEQNPIGSSLRERQVMSSVAIALTLLHAPAPRLKAVGTPLVDLPRIFFNPTR